ncbi:DUF4268 domain-containing protein [Sporosarcina ureilytica]|uniref:DUF4268 domain-containing protein n=1 Tax=Sporosarcina ureilytica TaxID=298596 RepID=A0A1D8JFA7_9BACL|nr:DUF4268 domain-containing protein [Sporosarcina ureilytica]AOV07373.1 hypothetical protein BI350_07360 [Sporosarcina ureilytica]
MFLIDREKNEATSIQKKTFQELQFTERQHLQEWIRKNTDILGESLLIIQKEFSGFDDTRERLDLLALDEEGNLVIIENKLDDSGRDVVWQSLKYASYCSSLTKNDVREIFQSYLDEQTEGGIAETILCEFFQVENFSEVILNHDDQRIIMVAANFRKEVTSTALWLLEHNIKIKCIKVTPYELDGNIFLDTEQIIPITDAEEYLIKIANKKQEESKTKEQNQTRFNIRTEFRKELLQEMNQQSDLFQNVGPTKDGWLSCGSGYSGISYMFVVTGSYARVELWIIGRTQSENKRIFDDLFEYKNEIEEKFGEQLDWQRLDEGKGSRVAYSLTDVNVYNREDWEKIIKFLTSSMIKFEQSIKDALREVMRR